MAVSTKPAKKLNEGRKADEDEARRGRADEAEGGEEESRRKADEAEGGEGEEESSRKKADEAEGGEQEGERMAGEAEDEARREVLQALRSMADEAASPEALQKFRDAFNAWADEEMGEPEHGGGDDGAGDGQDEGEEEVEARRKAAEMDGFAKYADEAEGGEEEGEEEAETEARRKAAEKDGFAKYADEAEEEAGEGAGGMPMPQCEACGAPVGKGGKFAGPAQATESNRALRHRLTEKEVRFRMVNASRRTLEVQNIRLLRENVTLRAELKPIRLRQDFMKMLREAKISPDLVEFKDFAPFPKAQWPTLLRMAVAPFRESGDGERNVTASSLLRRAAGGGEDEAGSAFTEAYAGGRGAYPGSADAEDPFAETSDKKQS